jgi:GTP-binding protein
MLTSTAGEGIMHHRFTAYRPVKEAIPGRSTGVLVSKLQGTSTAYSIDKLQDRGTFVIDPGEEVYTGMIIGEHTKPGDLVVNIIEGKKLTNMRASGSDAATNIAPKRAMTLEDCMEFIESDECIEVTPLSIRMRKVLLNEEDRKKHQRRLQAV